MNRVKVPEFNFDVCKNSFEEEHNGKKELGFFEDSIIYVFNTFEKGINFVGDIQTLYEYIVWSLEAVLLNLEEASWKC